MSELLRSAAESAIRYLDALGTRAVAPSAAAVERLAELREPLPEGPGDAEATLAVLERVVAPATLGIAGPRFFGFVMGGALPVTLAANWMAGAWDQNSGMYRATPGTAELEQVALGWCLDALGLPATFGGAFVTGATVANFTALAAARHVQLARVGWNVEADGLFGAPPITVVVSEEAHPSMIKSLGLLGLGRNRVLKVPVDDQGRMRVDAVPKVEGPAIVCCQLGNVNTGSVDALERIADRVAGSGAWIHVDGAFGLWAAASPSLRALVPGLARADSMATDAPQWLNVPVDKGLALVRDPAALRAAMAITAEYLPTETEHRNPSDYTPELSRRARGVEVWAMLRTLGRSGLAELVERNCRQARRFGAALSQAGYRVLNDVALNQVLVSFGDAAKTTRTIERIVADGTCWCGPTVWQGQTAMRISVCSWATTDADVELSIEAMLRAARGA